MAQLNVTQAFRWSPNGITIVRVERGVQDLPERAAEIALTNGYAEPVKVPKGRGK